MVRKDKVSVRTRRFSEVFGKGQERDTRCGLVFCFLFFCKGGVIENHTFFVSCSFCVWSWLCLWDPLPRMGKRESSCEGSLSEEGEKRPEGFWGEGQAVRAA